MTESTKGRGGRPPAWLLIVLGVGVVFYFLIVMPADREGATLWGVRGDAVAPIAALLNAGALIALLRSVGLQREALAVQQRELRLQRKELRLQRQEFQDSREVMKEQQEQFERTAKAQEDLAASQRRLADAQDEANRLAPFQELAARRMALATLTAGMSEIDFGQVQADRADHGIYGDEQKRRLEKARGLLEDRAREEGRRVDELEENLGLVPKENGR